MAVEITATLYVLRASIHVTCSNPMHVPPPPASDITFFPYLYLYSVLPACLLTDARTQAHGTIPTFQRNPNESAHTDSHHCTPYMEEKKKPPGQLEKCLSLNRLTCLSDIVRDWHIVHSNKLSANMYFVSGGYITGDIPCVVP